MDKNILSALLNKYLSNSITKEELSILIDELNLQENEDVESAIDELILNIEVEEYVLPELNKKQVLAKTLSAISAAKEQEIDREIDQESREHIRDIKSDSRRWLAIAASVLLVCSAAWFCLEKYDFVNTNLVNQLFEKQILLPDDQQAVVQLHDGRSLNLMEADEETLKQEGIEIRKEQNGVFTFIIKETNSTAALQNTFSTPKGVTSNLILADGTSVWLNSGSSITYPTHFEKENRKVEVKGEAYFEATKNPHKPFIVSVGQTTVKVLGTHFNVNSLGMSNEVYTTLMEGSVEVKTTKEVFKLSPGQQAISNEESGKIAKSIVDTKEVLAWKTGYFRFSDDDIYSVLNKLNVWYDIQEFTVKEETKDRFTGSIQRTKNLSDLLKQLEKISDYKFIIKEGRVIVMN